jgi:hypothetical protein
MDLPITSDTDREAPASEPGALGIHCLPCPEITLIWGYKTHSREYGLAVKIQPRIRVGQSVRVKGSMLNAERADVSGSLVPA